MVVWLASKNFGLTRAIRMSGPRLWLADTGLLGWTAPDGIECARVRSLRSQTREPPVNDLIRMGMDTSKSVFQLHGVNGAEQPVLRKKLRRGQVIEFFNKLPATQVGLEACGGAHHWAREIASLGHEVVVVRTQYVKP